MQIATHRRALAASLAGVLILALAACGGGSGGSGTKPAATGTGAAKTVDWQTVTSLADAGGMDALVAAAKKEGQLNVIALPPDWANYGEIIKAFEAKYGIKVNSQNPDGSSQDEINAVKTLKGQSRQPDVMDLGTSFAVSAAQQGLLAPYKVATWADIPTGLKESSGLWYADYGGFISIGYDAAKVKTPPTTFKSLDNPIYKGQVALNGDPTKAGAAFAGVFAAALANGGSFDNAAPGVSFFADLKKKGIFIPVQASPATLQSGQTPITLDWDYLQAGYAKNLKGKVDWKVVVPSDALYGSYYDQGIVKGSPNPAAARLWEEFLYSDEGQNLFLKGLARPVRLDAMTKAGTVDKTAAAALPPVQGATDFATLDQITAAQKVVAQNWAKEVG